MHKDPRITELARRLEKEFANRGKLIEGGWAGFKLTCIPINAPQIQLDEMKNAFFAGAAHLFQSIMSILEPGDEATEKDLDRMQLISDEIDLYLAEFEVKHGLAGTKQ